MVNLLSSERVFFIEELIRVAAGVAERGIVDGPFAQAQSYVLVTTCSGRQPRIDPQAVFHGFCTRLEAAAYFEAALPGVLIASVPSRP